MSRGGLYNQEPHPRMMARGMRADAYPEEGGPPGCSLPLLQQQHLDPNGIEFGMLIALGRGIFEERNQHFAEALSTAINDWQLERGWIRTRRLVAAIIVPQEDAEFAAAEIERRARDTTIPADLLSPKAQEPLGRKRYWPIYAAAERAGLPVAFHPAGDGRRPSVRRRRMADLLSGGAQHVRDDHAGRVDQHDLRRRVRALSKSEGGSVEGGFTWAPSLSWRMDKHWSRCARRCRTCQAPPSEYLRQQVWFTTQPMEETRKQAQLRDMIDWLGWDRLMFSSDYPHWDFDDPRYAFKIQLSDEERRKVFSGNAKELYGLP